MNKYSGVEQILYGYKELKAQIKDLSIQIEGLENMETIGITGIDYSRDKLCPTYAFNSETENHAIKIADKTILLNARKIHAESLLKRIDNALEALNEDENKMIKMKYIEGQKNKRSWYSIIGILGVSEATGYRIQDSALEKIENILFDIDSMIVI